MFKTISLSGFLALAFTFNAYAGLRVVIETEKPVSDFVVVCQWYSDFINLHGGKKRVKHKLFVASSGEEVDCGWALYGDASVEIKHPLYLTHHGCTYSEICDSPYQKVVGDILHMYPISIDKHLDTIKQEQKGNDKELRYHVLGFVAAHFNDNYFSSYRKVKTVDMDYFRATYNDDLVNFWFKVKNTFPFGDELSEPAVAVESYWKRNEYQQNK